MIVIVFDPLAVSLVLAYNIASNRKPNETIVEKINKVTVVVRTKYDDKYKLSLDRIIKYEDPFANWNY